MIKNARAEGTSSACASGKPSAISISIENDMNRIESMGFDCSSREASSRRAGFSDFKAVDVPENFKTIGSGR